MNNELEQLKKENEKLKEKNEFLFEQLTKQTEKLLDIKAFCINNKQLFRDNLDICYLMTYILNKIN